MLTRPGGEVEEYMNSKAGRAPGAPDMRERLRELNSLGPPLIFPWMKPPSLALFQKTPFQKPTPWRLLLGWIRPWLAMVPMKNKRPPFYEQVANRIIQQLKDGTAPSCGRGTPRRIFPRLTIRSPMSVTKGPTTYGFPPLHIVG